MKSSIALLLPLVAACATVGPTTEQVRSALVEGRPGAPTPRVDRLRCYAIDEEPTEFLCHWRQRDASGVWRALSGVFAIDGAGAHEIGGFAQVPPPLAPGVVRAGP